MALSPTVRASGNGSFSGDTFDTSSITPNADEVVYACIGVVFSASGQGDDVLSLTGNGLTWVRIAEVPHGRRSIAIFRAQGASPTTGAITVTDSGAGTPVTCCYGIVQFAEADTSGTNGSGATGTPTENTVSATSLGLTIPGTPAAKDATFAAMFVAADLAVTSDALWVNLTSNTDTTDMRLLSDWDADEDLSPTWTWTPTQAAAGIGFIVIGAVAAGGFVDPDPLWIQSPVDEKKEVSVWS